MGHSAVAEQWMAEQRATWEQRTERMAAFVETLHQQEQDHEKRNRRKR